MSKNSHQLIQVSLASPSSNPVTYVVNV